MSVLNHHKKFLLVLLISFFSHANFVFGQPGNCEDCYFQFNDGTSELEECLASAGCGEIPVDGNIWILALGGLVLAYFAYGKKK